MHKSLGQTTMRITFIVYLAYLTLLLMSQDPTRWIGASETMPEFLRMLSPIAHLLSFIILSFLTMVACLPLPRWGALLLLGLYGGATEIIQASIPHRHAEWTDWFQDLCGIMLGFIFFWLMVVLLRMFRGDECFRMPSSS